MNEYYDQDYEKTENAKGRRGQLCHLLAGALQVRLRERKHLLGRLAGGQGEVKFLRVAILAQPPITFLLRERLFQPSR